MHELFAVVLGRRDLSRAGDLFSVPDASIVDDLTQVVNRLAVTSKLSRNVGNTYTPLLSRRTFHASHVSHFTHAHSRTRESDRHERVRIAHVAHSSAGRDRRSGIAFRLFRSFRMSVFDFFRGSIRERIRVYGCFVPGFR